jgi:hypothetical protein
MLDDSEPDKTDAGRGHTSNAGLAAILALANDVMHRGQLIKQSH